MAVTSETPSLKLNPQVLGRLEKLGSSVELEDLGHVDFVTDGNANNSCIPGPLQTVQSAELWGVVLSLQAFVLLLKGSLTTHMSSMLFLSYWMDLGGLNHCHFTKIGDLVAKI